MKAEWIFLFGWLGDCRDERGAAHGGDSARRLQEASAVAAPWELLRRRPASVAAKRTRWERPWPRRRGSGCPHCAGREVVGLGPLARDFCGFACKSCGRTFNALTRTPMAHLRKKENGSKTGEIEGKSLAKTAQLCGVHPTTAFRWRHRFLRAPAAQQAATPLRRIVEADLQTFVLESFRRHN